MKITESEVLGIKSKQQLLFFCKQNLHNTHFIEHLVQYLNSNNSAIQIKVSWLFSCLVKIDKQSVQNQFTNIVHLVYFGQLDTINRNLLSCIKQLQIEKKEAIYLFDTCQKLSLSVDSALAVKVNSLYVMLDILSIYPDFYNEFEQILQILEESEASSIKAAIKNCRIKLKRIKR
jgi:predicted component of type VI protein secretion system